MRLLQTRLLLAAFSICIAAPGVVWSQAASPADTLNGKVRVVPNPWSASTNSQHYAGRKGNSIDDTKSGYSRVAFNNIPGTCTIRIYTVDGDLVKTIDHAPLAGQVPAYSDRWNLISDSDQYVVSGIYVFVVTTPDGQSEAGKFIIIR